MPIVVTFEPLGALYVQLKDSSVHRTVELVKDTAYIDVDENNCVVGIETLRPGQLASALRAIPEQYSLPKEASRIDFKSLEESFKPVPS